MLATARGDREAFRKLVERHQHRVVGAVSKMLGDGRDSEDLAQHVFLRVWNSAARYEPRAKFTTWLYRIMKNLVLNEVRRRDRARLDSLDERLAVTGDTLPDADRAHAGDQVLRMELELTVDAAIAALPETQRLAVVLRRYDELSYEEIAAILETSVSSVKSLLFRARAELKERLAVYLDGSGAA